MMILRIRTYLACICIILLIWVFAGACSKDALGETMDSPLETLRNSQWIESENRLDTLIFKSAELRMFDLRRPVDPIRNLPVWGAGLYVYELKTDSIAVQYLVSSSYNGDKFLPFGVSANGQKLSIGNFYDNRFPPSRFMHFDRLQ